MSVKENTILHTYTQRESLFGLLANIKWVDRKRERNRERDTHREDGILFIQS